MTKISNKTILIAISSDKGKKNFLKRLKREDEVINEVELKVKGEKCKDMKLASGYAGAAADLFDDVGDALGAIPVIGDVAKGLAKATVVAGHLFKNGYDIAQTAIDCDQVPFDEIKVLVNKKFNEVNRKLDKMTETLGEISDKVSITLQTVETARKEMKEGFKNLTDTIKNLDLDNKIAIINSFIDFYEEEMKDIKGLSKEDYLRKLLNDDILKRLREIKTPNQLRTPLSQLLSTVKSDLDKGEGIVHFHAIEAIFKGTQMYAFVMLFLLEQHAYLANYHYEMRELDKFNDQLDIIKDVLKTFSRFLIGYKKPLINNAIDILKKISNLSSQKHLEDNSISKMIEFLRSLKKEIKKINLSLISETPGNDIDISFKDGIEKPGSDWRGGENVEYALQFKKGKIYSKISKWKSFKISEKGNPSLRMPADVHRDRLIFRKIGKNKAELVGIIPKSEVDFRDIHRDLFNAAGNPTEKDATKEVKLYLDNGADVNAIFENGRSSIHAAAQAGHVDLVQLILNNKVDINKKYDEGYTPLHVAAESGREAIVNFLIKNNADINVKTNKDLLTPLHIASQRGYLECVKNLLHNDTVNERDGLGFTPLHSAISGGYKIVLAFVERSEYNTDVNAYSVEKQLTPMHLAVMNGDLKVVQALMTNNRLNLNVRDRNGITPLHYAALAPASKNSLKIVQELLNDKKRIMPNISSKNNWTPLHFALFNRNTDVALELLKIEDIDLSLKVERNYSFLHIAIATGQIEVIRELLKRKVSTEETTDEGYTALHLGAMRKESEIVPLLIGDGHLIQSKTKNGSTPLHLAAAANQSQTVLYLLNNGAQWKEQNLVGQYPIHEAVSRGHLEVTRVLLDKDLGNLSIKDKEGKSPFDIAAEHLYTDIIYELVNRGLDLKASYGDGRPPLSIFAKIGSLEMVKFFLSKGADPNAVDIENKNFFDLAAENGHKHIVEYVFTNKIIDALKIEEGVCKAINKGQLDIVKYFVEGNEMLCLPLQTASLNGQMHIVKYLVQEANLYINELKKHQTALCNAVKGKHDKIIRFLIVKRADIYGDCSTDSKKYTPLIYALEVNDYDIFKLLIDNLPNPNKQDGFDNTPLYYSAMFGCLKCVEYLIENKKADVNAKNNNDDTALHAAHEEYDSNLEIIEILMKHGADFHAKNKGGKSPAYSIGLWLWDRRQKQKKKGEKLSPIRKDKYGYRFRRNPLLDFASRPDSSSDIKSSTKLMHTLKRRNAIDIAKEFKKVHVQENRLLIDHEGGSKITGYSGSKNIDVNATLLLIDVLVKKITKENYKTVFDHGTTEMDAKADALNIMEEVEDFLTSAVDPGYVKDIDFSEVHSKVFKAIMSERRETIPNILGELLKNIPGGKIASI